MFAWLFICEVPAMHVSAIAERVLCPTTPYPFALGEPEQRFIARHWNCLTAVCVRRPK